MKIIIECECSNKIEMKAPPKKYLQMRDNLETKYFRYADAEYDEKGKIKKILITCDKCHNHIALGLD